MTASNLERLRKTLAGRLESLERAGVRQLPKARKKMPPELVPTHVPQTPTVGLSQSHRSEASPPHPPAANAEPPLQTQPVTRKSSWKSHDSGTLFTDAQAAPRDVSIAPTLHVLQEEVATCTRCAELACTRTQTVFGGGNADARLCFVGEAPGADEDRQGEPFVGRAGQLLNKIIEACRMRREDVYICNILKCRPPENRNPTPAEAANCRRFLERQLELIQPEFICCLGSIAAQNLLGTTQSIGKLRGKLHHYRGAQVVCTYHPAYLLRNPAAKKDTWEDMKFLIREMGMEL
jgi:DNA polymerase